jgi:hypothetical protein
VRLNIMVRSIWWNKAAHLMVALKAKRERVRDKIKP